MKLGKYVVFRNGRKLWSKSFSTYEEARSYARKLIRKAGYTGNTCNYNPSISANGFTIKLV